MTLFLTMDMLLIFWAINDKDSINNQHCHCACFLNICYIFRAYFCRIKVYIKEKSMQLLRLSVTWKCYYCHILHSLYICLRYIMLTSPPKRQVDIRASFVHMKTKGIRLIMKIGWILRIDLFNLFGSGIYTFSVLYFTGYIQIKIW